MYSDIILFRGNKIIKGTVVNILVKLICTYNKIAVIHQTKHRSRYLNTLGKHILHVLCHSNFNITILIPIKLKLHLPFDISIKQHINQIQKNLFTSNPL